MISRRSLLSLLSLAPVAAPVCAAGLAETDTRGTALVPIPDGRCLGIKLDTADVVWVESHTFDQQEMAKFYKGATERGWIA